MRELSSATRPFSVGAVSRLWRGLCIVAALEAAVALVCLVAVPREAAAFSVARLSILAFLLGSLVFFAVAAYRLPPPPPHIQGALIPVTAMLGLLTLAALYLLRYLDPVALLPYYERLRVPLFYLLALSLQTLVVFSLPRGSAAAATSSAFVQNLRRAGLLWVILVAILFLIGLTGIGITPDAAYWGEPGVPILGWQLGLAVLGGLATLLMTSRLAKASGLDAGLGAVIWLLAVVVWLAVPIEALQNSFYAPIGPPTGVPFPNSDAGYYDSMAHSLLVGHPYQGELPSRPLYIVLLTGLHLLFGERYDRIIVGQTLILALVPVFLFCIGSAVHSRPAGVIAALAAIGREWTSLMVSSATRVSNSKMLLVDLPTLLAMLIFCWLMLRWLKQQSFASAAIAGASFAVLLLLRTQAVVLLPIALLFACLAIGLRRPALPAQLALFVAAAAITLAPWLLHNYLATGQLTMDAAFQYRIIASQYRYTGNLDIQSIDLEGKSIIGILATFAARDPAFVLGFILNHAVATQVGGLLALPFFHSFRGLLAGIEPYWVAWDGTLSTPNLLLAWFYLAIIALGLVSAWSRWRWAGLLPVGLSLGYSLANGIARFSGWRYDLPADWVAYFYFAVGVGEILLMGSALFGGPDPGLRQLSDARRPLTRDRPTYRLVPLLMSFALIGALPWLATRLASPRYAGATAQGLASRLSSSVAVRSVGVSQAQIESALLEPGMEVEAGRLLYPRFFYRGNGLASAHPWPAYAPRDFPRLGFLLLNDVRQDVLLPTRLMPDSVRHAADAVVLGCQRDGYIEARLVLLPQFDVVLQGAALSDPCQ